MAGHRRSVVVPVLPARPTAWTWTKRPGAASQCASARSSAPSPRSGATGCTSPSHSRRGVGHCAWTTQTPILPKSRSVTPSRRRHPLVSLAHLRQSPPRETASSTSSGRHTCGLKAQDLILLGCADRTADRLADTASRRGLARFCRRRNAGQVRFRNHLSHNEAPTESEPRQPLFGLMLPRCTDFSFQHQEGPQILTGGPNSFVRSDTCRFHRLVPRHR